MVSSILPKNEWRSLSWVVKKVPSKSMLANTSTPLQNANNYLGLLSVFSYGTLLYGKICLMITNVWKITFRPFLLVHHPCSKLRTPHPIIFTHHKKSVRESHKGQCSKLCTKVINTMYVQRKHAEKDWLVFPEALKPFCFIHFIETEPCFEKVTFFHTDCFG